MRIDRRRFRSHGLTATVGLGVLGPGAARPAGAGSKPTIRGYPRLGRTDIRMSDISFGSSRMADADLVRQALDRGINYFDTAESYRGGRAESAIGVALTGMRDQVYIASKTKAREGDSRADMMRALEGSLRRLRTDYLDVYFNHAVNGVGRMRNPEWWEFTERAKLQGKIRYRAMSGHGSGLVASLEYALQHDLVDVILVAYSFAQDPAFYHRLRHTFHYVALQPDLPPLLARAKAQGVGVIAMKTLMGARLNDMRPFETGGATFAQAAFRWVLSDPSVDALVISMTDARRMDEYVAASGPQAVSAAEFGLLERYAALNGRRYCQPGCDACAERCPFAVPISEVLRTRMYAADYGDLELAVTDYARLGAGAAACLDCSEEPCRGACPNQLPIAELTRDAALRLGRRSLA